MNKQEFKGRISTILPVQSGTGDKGEWKSVDFVVKEVGGDYPQSAVFRLWGLEKVDNFMKYNSEGSDVIVSFNLSAREWNGKYFNSLDAWKVFKDDGASNENAPNLSTSEPDDLPF